MSPVTAHSLCYLDTSSYLTILLGESGFEWILKSIAGQSLCSSTILLVETQRNLVRLSREKFLSQEQYHQARRQVEADQELFTLRDLTVDLCQSLTFPAVTTPRSLDLIHLTTAFWFHREYGLKIFVSQDKKQRISAQGIGLPIVMDTSF